MSYFMFQTLFISAIHEFELGNESRKKAKIFTLVRHGRSARDGSNPQMEQFRSAGTDNYM